MQAEAFAKINLSLRVRARDSSGLHPIRSTVQSIDWADRVVLEAAESDEFVVDGIGVPEDGSNLALRALGAVREASDRVLPVRLTLYKRIPVAAGLGGGSADAAAVLALGARLHGMEKDHLAVAAPALGADVAFCLRGGTALMEGHGEIVTSLPLIEGIYAAVVVPPFRLATADVYRRWDELGGPSGPAIGEKDLPARLRGDPPVNDLFPAAVAVAPELGDWAADLRRRWGIPVAMSGSGPSLFGLFPTESEARGAVAEARGVRAGRACAPVDRGWRIGEG